MSADFVADWLQEHPLSPLHIDCVTTVMLKILDGKCKMRSAEKLVIEQLYDHTKHLEGQLFAEDLHELIATARQNLDEDMKNHVYEKRLLAETILSRPVMKGFKAMIRQQGLLQTAIEEEEDN